MNQVFDFNRFTMLVAKHWSENRKKYTLGVVAMAGLLFFWYGFAMMAESSSQIREQLQAMTYFVGLALSGCFYGSILFSDLASGPKAMNYLIFPASHFEKLATGLLYGVLFFFIAYTAVYYLVTFPMVEIGNNLSNTYKEAGESGQTSRLVNVFRGSFGYDVYRGGPNPFFIFILLYVAAQSAYILGSIYFPKFSFIKTTISLLIAALIITLFVSKVLHPMLPDRGYYNGLTSFRVLDGNRFDGPSRVVTLPGWISGIVWFVLQYAFAPIFWLVSYFRLKEKQV
jgi:hypothetical protein